MNVGNYLKEQGGGHVEDRCPYCGLKLAKNNYGDLVCPNCGIIKQHEEERTDKTPSYLG